MKIAVDHSKCAGIGICESVAPSLFEVRESGAPPILLNQAPVGDEVDLAEDAVASCPMKALSLNED
ncbi:ferredoxin reductase [Mycobacterium intracellulare subsp. chimaera]|uniref:ferredoxin n=1 Tax=Mycobacterium intracellulare TaxID=1767 RepID=UPI00093AF648|nr:ferredoxin [Mycobacterium intracellulare]ASL07140.1 ferredoxin reductase [Mycobacterium intracellulare subsp. chimaera]MCV7323020.1 ferredoxin [Mycobacterium intracellulare subsp. chimaera]